MWFGNLGKIAVMEHRIDFVLDAKPFKSAPYRAGPKTREIEQFEINEKLKADVIEPVLSEWAAPSLFTQKKGGKLRFCLEYRGLDVVIVKEAYLLLRMDECIDLLRQAQDFTALHEYAGYWQMSIRKEHHPKAAFVRHAGSYQYKGTLFKVMKAQPPFNVPWI